MWHIFMKHQNHVMWHTLKNKQACPTPPYSLKLVQRRVNEEIMVTAPWYNKNILTVIHTVKDDMSQHCQSTVLPCPLRNCVWYCPDSVANILENRDLWKCISVSLDNSSMQFKMKYPKGEMSFNQEGGGLFYYDTKVEENWHLPNSLESLMMAM